MNKKIKIQLAISGLRQWELAELLNVSESVLCRKLRRELPEEEQQRIVSIIKEHAKEGE